MNSNPLNIPVLTLPGNLPSGTVISVAELANRIDVAKLRVQAEVELEQARKDADAMREAAIRAAEQDIAVLRQQAREVAVADAVQWMCSEQQIEHLIAMQLTIRWRRLTAQILESVFGKSEHNELLLRRVERELIELLPHGRLTLYVEPAALTLASQNFAEIPEIAVVADSELSVGQARLDNGLVCVYLDEREYQTKLLEQLVGTAEKGGSCLDRVRCQAAL